jgi:hypothetical protein
MFSLLLNTYKIYLISIRTTHSQKSRGSLESLNFEINEVTILIVLRTLFLSLSTNK